MRAAQASRLPKAHEALYSSRFLTVKPRVPLGRTIAAYAASISKGNLAAAVDDPCITAALTQFLGVAPGRWREEHISHRRSPSNPHHHARYLDSANDDIQPANIA